MRKEFYTGHLFDVYRYFGAHKEGENFIFRVFAPSAKGVCVFGEFSNWTEIPMYQECCLRPASPSSGPGCGGDGRLPAR